MSPRNENGKYQCSHCPISFAARTALEAHVRSKHQGILLDCSKCDQKFPDRSNLNRHKRNVHHETKWEFWCTKCNKSVATRKDNADRHERKKEGECKGFVHKRNIESAQEKQQEHTGTQINSDQLSGAGISSLVGSIAQPAELQLNSVVAAIEPASMQQEWEQNLIPDLGVSHLLYDEEYPNFQMQQPYQQELQRQHQYPQQLLSLTGYQDASDLTAMEAMALPQQEEQEQQVQFTLPQDHTLSNYSLPSDDLTLELELRQAMLGMSNAYDQVHTVQGNLDGSVQQQPVQHQPVQHIDPNLPPFDLSDWIDADTAYSHSTY